MGFIVSALAMISIGPKFSRCRQTSSPDLYSSSSANRVTAWVMRSDSATASSNENDVRERSRSRRCARRRSSDTVTRVMWLVSTGGGTRSRAAMESASRCGS